MGEKKQRAMERDAKEIKQRVDKFNENQGAKTIAWRKGLASWEILKKCLAKDYHEFGKGVTKIPAKSWNDKEEGMTKRSKPVQVSFSADTKTRSTCRRLLGR